MSNHDWALVQEVDGYSPRPALLIAMFTMLVILGTMVLCAALVAGATGSLRTSGRALTSPSPRTPREIGGVKQTLIDVDDYGRRLQAAQRDTLERFEWTDRAAGRVDVPISEGMRLVIEGGGR